jgi:hypothetical protein
MMVTTCLVMHANNMFWDANHALIRFKGILVQIQHVEENFFA